jgi:ketosteroid isomerase-like protein
MISKEQASQFASEWIDAWNKHDLELILSHYDDDIEMTTPFIIQLMHEPTGTLKGKTRLKEYWEQALKRIPDLNFKLIEVLSSVNSITIYYHAVMEKRAVEFLIFNDEGKVIKSIAHYN